MRVRLNNLLAAQANCERLAAQGTVNEIDPYEGNRLHTSSIPETHKRIGHFGCRPAVDSSERSILKSFYAVCLISRNGEFFSKILILRVDLFIDFAIEQTAYLPWSSHMEPRTNPSERHRRFRAATFEQSLPCGRRPCAALRDLALSSRVAEALRQLFALPCSGPTRSREQSGIRLGLCGSHPVSSKAYHAYTTEVCLSKRSLSSWKSFYCSAAAAFTLDAAN